MNRSDLMAYLQSMAGEADAVPVKKKSPVKVSYGGIFPDPLGNMWAMDKSGRRYIAYNTRKPQLNVNDPQMSGTHATIYNRGDTLVGPPSPAELELYLEASGGQPGYTGTVGLRELYQAKKRMSGV